MKRDNPKLNSYIDRIIQDACEAEERPIGDSKYEYRIIEEQDLVIAIRTPYARVTRRVCSRLQRNLAKNFKLNLHLVDTGGCAELSARYRIHPSHIDANNDIDQCIVFGKPYYLAASCGTRFIVELGVPHLKRLQGCGYDYTNPEHTNNWDLFKDAYHRAYSETPYDGFLRESHWYGVMRDVVNSV